MIFVKLSQFAICHATFRNIKKSNKKNRSPGLCAYLNNLLSFHPTKSCLFEHFMLLFVGIGNTLLKQTLR